MAQEQLSGLTALIPLPQGVEAKIDGSTIIIKGRKGESARKLPGKLFSIAIHGGNITLATAKDTKREKKMLWTYDAHIRNMIKGATAGHLYRLKVCSGHFPMTAVVTGKKFSVKNLLGEKVPREFMIRDGVQVKVEGDIITVESVQKELAGKCAASIEILTRRSGFDRRVFQDGIYIIEKDGKEIR